MELCYDCFCEVWGKHKKEDLTIDYNDSCDECFQSEIVVSANFDDNLFEGENLCGI